MTMEVIKTTIGHALKQIYTDNVAFTIASFLVEENDDIQAYVREALRKNDEREEREIRQIL